jgi:hypothetical protein
MMGKDENFVHGDGIEPSLDPAPDCGEEGRCANYLIKNPSLILISNGR